jgi:hypothetical protein
MLGCNARKNRLVFKKAKYAQRVYFMSFLVSLRIIKQCFSTAEFGDRPGNQLWLASGIMIASAWKG